MMEAIRNDISGDPHMSIFSGLRLRFVLIALVAFGQTPPPTPLVANLTSPLDVSRAKVGTPVHALVIAAWSSAGCQLAVGALVEGHVSQVDRRSKTDQKSDIHLVFDRAECNKKKGTPLKLTVFALLGPMGEGRDVTDVPVQSASTSGTAAPDVAPAPTSGFRSVEGATQVNRLAPQGRPVPTKWTSGMVVGLPNMNLTAGTGAEGGSIVWVMNKDARLEAQTTLFLMPAN
jgi:hypothetical protein